MGSPVTNFSTTVSTVMWPALLAMFGSQMEYWPGHDSIQALTINAIFKEGALGEETSPGRYSNITVQISDLPAGPKKGDAVVRGTKTYAVARVAANAYGFAELILQEEDDTP